MGNLTSAQETQKFFQKISFTQELNDQNFGLIQIWRSNELPYQYLMNYKRTFLDKDKNYNDYIQLIQNLQGKVHKNIAKLYHLEQNEDNQMCIKNMKVSTFFNYYNFTLTKLLSKKRELRSSFPEKQLWYILKSLVDAARFLRNNNISIGDYKMNKIFVTPEGYIKLYLIGIANQNRHNSYYQVLCSLEQLDKHLLSPQQLDSLVKGHESITFNVYSSDMFSIGMIMLELIFLDEARFYYNYENFQVNFDKIKYNFQQMKNIYSPQLINIVLACLEKNPQKRIDFESAFGYIEELNHVRPVSKSLRLNFEEEDKRKIVKYEPVNNMLPKSINQKLVVIPISIKSEKNSSDGSSSIHHRKSNFTQSSSDTYNDRKFNF